MLVPSYEAVLLRDKGWKELYSQEALWQLDRAMDPWWPGQLRNFVAAIDLHGSMSDTPDSRLLDIVRLAIENGSLVPPVISAARVPRPRFRSVGPVERARVLVAPEYVAIDRLL